MAKLIWKQLAYGNDKSDIITWRAEVPGGWLVSVWAATARADAKGTPRPGGANWGGGVTFVPDSEHEWDADSGDDEQSASDASVKAPKKNLPPGPQTPKAPAPGTVDGIKPHGDTYVAGKRGQKMDKL